MTSHYTLYDVIGYHDVTWIAHVTFVLQCDVFLHSDLKKKKYSNKNIFISYGLWAQVILPPPQTQ